MPVRLNGEDLETLNNMEEDSDEEVISIKRHKKSHIESDDSDEVSDKGQKLEDGHINDILIPRESNDSDIKNDVSSDDEILIPSRNVPKSTENAFQNVQKPALPTSTTTEAKCQERNFKQLFSNKDLYDSEDSDDDYPSGTNTLDHEIPNDYDAEGSSDEGSEEKRLAEKKSKTTNKKSVEKKSKPAKNYEKKKEVDEIHSETQRLVRQSRVSLPYHKPRQRTLAEFLQRRPSVPTKSIRMSTDELKLLAKQVAKRAREAEEFYKSSSDEEQSVKPDKTRNKKEDEAYAVLLPRSVGNNGEPTEKGEMPKGVNGSDKIEILNENVCTLVGSKTGQEGLQDLGNVVIEVAKCLRDSDNIFATCDKSDSVKLTSVTPFVYEEIDSQDLCLRIEDTEMGDETGEKRQIEQNLSTVIKNVLKSDEEKLMSVQDRPLISVNGEIESQDLCLRIEDSESFDKVTNEKKEKLNAEILFSKPVPNIMTTEDYGKSALHKSKMCSGKYNCLPEEIDSQDLCLRIENSDTLDVIEKESSERLEEGTRVTKMFESVSDNANENKLLPRIDKLSSVNNCAADEVVSRASKIENPCLLAEMDKSDLLGSDQNKFSLREDATVQKSSRKNLTNLFSDSESILNVDVSSECVEEKNNADSVKLILEGEETRIAFEHDSILLNGKTPSESNASENMKKYKPGFLSPEGFQLESTDDRTELVEKKKEYSKQSYHLLQHTKDVSSDNNENVLNVIKKLRGDDDSKNDKLLRTMSLLEDRLKSTRKSLKLQNEVPQLKGSPNKVIDLDDTPSTCDINTLKQRFLRHSFPKPPAPKKTSVDVSVVTAEKGPTGEYEVKKEIVSVESETENLLGSRAKLLKLKEKLQRQIVKEREKEWNRRQLEAKEADPEAYEEKSDCGLFENDEEILESDDSLNSEDGNDEDEEEDEEVDDEQERHKIKQRSCAFVDDEAEVSDEDYDRFGNSDDEEDDKFISEETTSTKDINEEISETSTFNNSLKRMKTLDPFESQEVPSDVTNEPELSPASLKGIKRTDPSQTQDTDGDAELESSLSIPPYQPGGAVSQISDPVGDQLYMNILPPTLPTLYKEDECTENVFSQFPQTSSFSELGIQNSLKEADAAEAELLGLCSGKFTSQLSSMSQEDSLNANSGLSASGKKTEEIKPFEKLLPSNKYEEESFLEDTQTDLLSRADITKETKTNDAFLVNRKKFVILSDDEDEPENKVQKKSQLKLIISDDEDELGNTGDESASDVEDEPEEVEYDSEENEIAVKPAAAKDFFENEAELSESEWDSADEDEKDIDDFEDEEGDDEKLDQHKLKEQLGKIHMRRILDEDQQEVRRLQELLLEDGEFHSEGGGRQRQFRWKNLNNANDFQFSRKSDDETVGDEEEEDESQWRRMRFERETFLREHKNSLVKENDTLIDTVKLKFKTPVLVPRKTEQIKRGSFLTRSEAALARIAQMTKNSRELNLTAPTKSRNFVFAHLSQDSKEEVKGTKRKAVKVETPVAKKMRLSASLLDQIG